MNDNLPPLPKPEALQRKQLSHGGYEMRPVFTPEQMREYGQLCRHQALKEAADECERMMMYPGGRQLSAAHDNVWQAAKAIRSLK